MPLIIETTDPHGLLQEIKDKIDADFTGLNRIERSPRKPKQESGEQKQ